MEICFVVIGLGWKRLLRFGFFGFVLFLLLGGVNVVSTLVSGRADSYGFYCLLTLPFVVVLAGFCGVGLWLVRRSFRMFCGGDVRARFVLLGGFGLVFLVFFVLDFIAFPRG